MACEDGRRRVITLSIPANGEEEYTFTEVPLADPICHVHEPAADEANVSLDLSADGETWSEWRGWFALSQSLIVVIPRSVAAIRLRSTEAVEATLAILEDS